MRSELKEIRRNLLEASLLLSVVVFLTILSFPHFFFFLPNFSGGNALLASVQSLSQLGWIVFIFVPPFLVMQIREKKALNKRLFFISVLLWPISTLIIKLVLLVQTKNLFLDYLTSFPIFLFLEFLAPAVYLYLYFRSFGRQES